MKAFAVLADPAFRRLWIGATASGLATWALPFILGLALVAESISAGQLGILLAIRTVGFLLIMPLAGVVADLWSPRKAVVGSGLLAASGTTILASTMWLSSEKIPLTTLIVAAFGIVLVGIGQGAVRPAYQTLIAANVAENDRQSANAANTLSVRIVVVLAPALAAVASRIIGVSALILLTAMLWLIVAASTKGVLEAKKKPTETSTRSLLFDTGQGLVDGLKEAKKHRWFHAGLGLLMVVIMLGYSATGVLLPLVSVELGGDDTILATGTTAYALGAIGGAILVAHWRPKAQGWWAFAGLAAYGLVALAMALCLAVGTHWIIIVIAYIIVGIGIEVFNVPWFTGVQREVEPTLVARVSSIDFLISYGLAPLGLAIMPFIAIHFGLVPILIIVAISCAIAGILACLVPGTKNFHDPRVMLN